MARLSELMKRDGIVLQHNFVGTQKDPDWGEHYLWQVTLRRTEETDDWGNEWRIHTEFHTGTEFGEPTVVDVMSCVISDALSFDNNPTFEDFAAEFGYDSDSRRAEGIYNACREMSVQVHNFLGPLFDEYAYDVDGE